MANSFEHDCNEVIDARIDELKSKPFDVLCRQEQFCSEETSIAGNRVSLVVSSAPAMTGCLMPSTWRRALSRVKSVGKDETVFDLYRLRIPAGLKDETEEKADFGLVYCWEGELGPAGTIPKFTVMRIKLEPDDRKRHDLNGLAHDVALPDFVKDLELEGLVSDSGETVESNEFKFILFNWSGRQTGTSAHARAALCDEGPAPRSALVTGTCSASTVFLSARCWQLCLPRPGWQDGYLFDNRDFRGAWAPDHLRWPNMYCDRGHINCTASN